MEAIIGTALQDRRLDFISALVIVVPKLMMNGIEILAGYVDAHFDPEIIVINIPGAGMALNNPVARFGKQRALPKGFRHRVKAQGRKEILAGFYHLQLVVSGTCQKPG